MTLTFLPWLRMGMAGAIASPDADGLPNRAVVHVGLKINHDSPVPKQPVELLGPGDVVGIDPGQVIRTDPLDGAPDHEHARLAAVELASPSLPWDFTPATAGELDRLRPWLALVVVREQDGVALRPGPRPGGTVLDVKPPAVVAAELPEPAGAWAWAHVQVAGRVSDEPALLQLLERAPERALSRLLCPRVLEPGQRYIACVVPVFAAGREAGLGRRPAPPAGLETAWKTTDSAASLPVYHSWRFGTAPAGDFTSLAAALAPQPSPAGVGERALDVADLVPGHAPLTLTGALRATGNRPTPDAPGAVREALAALLAHDADAVKPPIYGAAHAGADSMAAAGVGWLAELNLDPRHRLAAALGAQLVREHQEAFVAAAWEQAGGAQAANDVLDRARLGRATGTVQHEQHLEPLPLEALLQVTAPAHGRMRASPVTLHAQLAASALPDAAVAPAFRRLTRPRGPVMRSTVAASTASEARTQRPAGARASAAAVAWRVAGLPAAQALTGARAASATASGPAGDRPLAGLSKQALLERLDPESTVPARMRGRVRVAAATDAAPQLNLVPAAEAATTEQAADPLARVLPAPSFPTPVVPALAARSPERVLPGADRLLPNAVVLLETDPAFVASFMVGLNHELGRELVWRGFPVDRRATFCRHFWDSRGHGAGAPDILPLRDWDAETSLAAAGSVAGEHVVLAFRGDLLRRYPRTIVYAVPAVEGPGGPRPDADTAANTLEPGFTCLLEPDIRCVGFALSMDQLRSAPGWFFVLQEPATETRFTTRHASGPEPTAATVAADALEPLQRIAIHASDLLPKAAK